MYITTDSGNPLLDLPDQTEFHIVKNLNDSTRHPLCHSRRPVTFPPLKYFLYGTCFGGQFKKNLPNSRALQVCITIAQLFLKKQTNSNNEQYCSVLLNQLSFH